MITRAAADEPETNVVNSAKKLSKIASRNAFTWLMTLFPGVGHHPSGALQFGVYCEIWLGYWVWRHTTTIRCYYQRLFYSHPNLIWHTSAALLCEVTRSTVDVRAGYGRSNLVANERERASGLTKQFVPGSVSFADLVKTRSSFRVYKRRSSSSRNEMQPSSLD